MPGRRATGRANPDRRALALDDLLRLQSISDPQLSPDGARVAFVVERPDREANETRAQVMLVEVDGGAPPRALTAGACRDTEPRWSPDGRTLAFVSDRSGKRQILTISLDGGEPRQLTDHPVGAGGPVWSPDGGRIAYLAPGAARAGEPVPVEEADPRRRIVRVTRHRQKLDGRGYLGPASTHLWVVDVAAGESRQLTAGDYEHASPAWSPDGTRLAVVSDRSAQRDRHFNAGALYVVDARNGRSRRVTAEPGRATVPAWSPDGGWIAYAGSDRPLEASASQTRLWAARPDGVENRCLTAGLRRGVGHRPGGYLSPSPPGWQADGRHLLYLLSDGATTHLARFDVDGGAPETLTPAGACAHTVSASANGRRVALLLGDPATPPEVWVWDDDGGARPLTSLNRPLLDEIDLGARARIALERPDGVSLEGWLYTPPGRRRAPLPLVLVVHGGPHNYFGDTFAFDHRLFAGRGYAVLAVNPRGSGGYDERFAEAVVGDWGGGDYDDQIAMLEHVLERDDPPIDSARLAITGGSYGGFMTCWALTRTDRFAVGIAGCCVSNLVSFYGTSDIGPSWVPTEAGGTPDERREWYRERSPLTHAGRVRTPLLLYHGEADLRCPIEQSEQLFTALTARGRTVELVRVPTEGHNVLGGSPAHQEGVRQIILEWLSRYLDA